VAGSPCGCHKIPAAGKTTVIFYGNMKVLLFEDEEYK
jgi:hypothetical protein